MVVLLWAAFVAMVILLLIVDLKVTGRHGYSLTVGHALAWTSFYVLLALIFNGLVYLIYENHWLDFGIGDPTITGREATIQFFTAWLIEKSLSVDNIFVIALIFSYFGIRKEDQHRVLFWGILGALVLRGILILVGAELLRRVVWMSYLFGAVLFFTAVRMLVARHDNLRPERNLFVRLARRVLPVSGDVAESRFFVRVDGKLAMTPLFLALLVVESADLLFAVDSVPAALAVTTEPFLVFTSNIFAVLGLRALYFVLAGYMERLRHLKVSLVFLLSYVGVKIMLSPTYHIPNLVSLAVIGGILLVGVVASLVADEDTAALVSPLADDRDHLGVIRRRHATRVAISMLAASVLILVLALIVAPDHQLPVLIVGLVALAVELAYVVRSLMQTNATEPPVTSPVP